MNVLSKVCIHKHVFKCKQGNRVSGNIDNLVFTLNKTYLMYFIMSMIFTTINTEIIPKPQDKYLIAK